jgi:hypothetical protein
MKSAKRVLEIRKEYGCSLSEAVNIIDLEVLIELKRKALEAETFEDLKKIVIQILDRI